MARARVVAVLLIALVVSTGVIGPAVALAEANSAVAAPDSAVTGPDSAVVGEETAVTEDTDFSPARGGQSSHARVGRPGPGDPLRSSDSGVESRGVAGENGSAVRASEPAATVRERIVLSQDDERGYFRVTFEYDIPANVSALNVTVPFEYTFTGADGFERLDPTTVRWTEDDETTTPSVTFRIIADVGGRGGNFQFVDTGDWALVRTPGRTLEWSSQGEIAVETTYDVDGEGAVGSDISFLGPHEEYVAEAGSETIRLVVPDAADLADSPEEILDALVRASEELSVGGESDDVLMVAAPADEPDWLEWAALGLQRGESDAWVRADVPLESVTSTWLHEYVHTRQGYEPDAHLETEWLVEAQADYYAALLALEFDWASFEQFRAKLRLGQHSSVEDVVLNDRTTWQGTLGNYLKGALVVGRLDYAIRAATSGALTFQNAFRAMNERDGRIDHESFVEIVRALGGPAAARAADRFAGTAATPRTWDRESHEETFVERESPVVYRTPGEPFGVDGEVRETTLAGPVATGENLTATVHVENTAAFNATFEVSLSVGGETVATGWGILEPGENRTVTLSHAFETPGEYEVAVRGETRTVVVREPATPVVAGLSVDPSSVERGEQATVTATVENPGEVPGERVIEIAVDGRVVHTERVALPPGEETTVETTIRPAAAGTVTVAAGNRSAELAVREPTASPTPSPDTPGTATDADEQSPGFTGGIALVAVVSVAVLAARLRE